MIGKCWCGDWHQISITLLLVNCHDVTGGIFEWWILRKTGMKSPLKWHNQPGKNRVMLRCYYQRSQLKLCFQFHLSFHSFHCFYGTVGLSLQWKQSQWQSKISITLLICNISFYYMEESVLLGTKPLIDSIRHFIRDPSGVFSVCHLCECRIVQWRLDSRLLLLLKWFLHIIKRTLHVGSKIWILCSRGKNNISLVRFAHSWDIVLATRT